MATRLSSTPLAPNLHRWDGVFVPFTAFLKYDPQTTTNKRLVPYRDMEQLSAWIEDQLLNVCLTEELQLDFARPIAFTPQFGQQGARFTVHGHACKKASFTKQPVESEYVDNPGPILGYDNSRAQTKIPVTNVEVLCKELKLLLESTTGLLVTKLDVAGVIYGGRKGRTFPL